MRWDDCAARHYRYGFTRFLRKAGERLVAAGLLVVASVPSHAADSSAAGQPVTEPLAATSAQQPAATEAAKAPDVAPVPTPTVTAPTASPTATVEPAQAPAVPTAPQPATTAAAKAPSGAAVPVPAVTAPPASVAEPAPTQSAPAVPQPVPAEAAKAPETPKPTEAAIVPAPAMPPAPTVAATTATPAAHPVIAAVVARLGVAPAAQTETTPTAAEPEFASPPPVSMAGDLDVEAGASPEDFDAKGETVQPVISESEALAQFYRETGRTPLWTDANGYNKRADAVLREFAAAADYGLRPEDFAVARPNLAAATSFNEILADAELALTKAALKYARYAKGGRIDPRKLSRFQERGPLAPDYPALLQSLAKDPRPGVLLRGEHPQHPQFEALRQKLLALGKVGDIADPAAEASEKERLLLLINMERWRWMPDKLEGNNNIYVWANVPELHVRVIRDGKEAFKERAIVGQQGKQTPMFSDEMEWIEINPTWYIPDSIKVADILPNLRRKGDVIDRFHIKIDCGKNGSDFKTIDWKTVNIRTCAVTQPAGANSVLGNFKFKFPNRFSVYMHDTLNRNLFEQKTRVLSHGCVRVDNPQRMAELLLQNDRHPSAAKIDAILASRAQYSAHLRRKIPVHLTYFSALVGDDGKLETFPDYYGHDHRLAEAMFGRGRLFPVLAYAGSQSGKPRIPRPAPEAEALPQFYR